MAWRATGWLMVTFPLLLAALLPDIPGRIEGWVAPVVAEAQLLRVVDSDLGTTTFAAAGIKRRSCSFVRIEWYLGERSGLHAPVPARFLDPPQVRPAGALEWLGLRVGLPRAQIGDSFADVIHDCPWRPYETRSPFFTGRNAL